LFDLETGKKKSEIITKDGRLLGSFDIGVRINVRKTGEFSTGNFIFFSRTVEKYVHL